MRTSSLLGHHMVLQRGQPVPVWGQAVPGEKVTVIFNEQAVSGFAGADGSWRIDLPPLAVSENQDLVIESGTGRVVFHDVSVGEVWLCTGQSNMEWPLLREDYSTEISQSAEFDIRFFSAAKTASPEVQSSVSGVWQVLSPENATQCSAVAYFLARELRKILQVPVGLILSSYGGSSGESWVSREGLAKDKELDQLATREILGLARFEKDRDAYPGLIAKWGEPLGVNDSARRGDDLNWAKPDVDKGQWLSTSLPFKPCNKGISGGASVWFRRVIDIPLSIRNQDHTLDLGWQTGDIRAWWNGIELLPPTPEPPRFFACNRQFRLPRELLQEGRGELVFRLFCSTNNWNFTQPTRGLRLPVSESETLDDEWLYRVENLLPVLSEFDNNNRPIAPDRTPHQTPTYLYNGMIAPLIPYAVKGVAWYQGETNVGRSNLYRRILQALIRDWRTRWGQPDLPFLIVQLANFNPAPDYNGPPPTENYWAELRGVQADVVKNTIASGLVVTIDIGDGSDVHPRNKKDVGLRLAWVALAEIYGLKIDCRGPEFESFTTEGDVVRIKFRHAKGLHSTKAEPLNEFMLAGADRKFFWGKGRIEGESVVVQAAEVKVPVAIRFAWTDNPERFSLYNASGLPAVPIRTDNWVEIKDAPFPL